MNNQTTKIMDIFEYAAANEAAFEKYWAECGHERKTTFFSDLSIAECYGCDGIRDTYNRVIKSWMDNLVFITEFIACLGLKASQWSARNGKFNGTDSASICECYSHLFDVAHKCFYRHYENDSYAKNYFFDMID